MKPKLCIIGHKRHGKDSVAIAMSACYGYTFRDSSQAALDLFLFDILKERHGYKTPEDAYRDRVNHRKEWFDEIAKYNEDDPTRLAREIISTSDIYVGMRSKRELYACQQAELFDWVIWVDASFRRPFEAPESISVDAGDADYTIDNNFTETHLLANVAALPDFLHRKRF